MCGRYYLTATGEEIIRNFGLTVLPRYQHSYNIPPGQKILTVVAKDNGQRKSAYLLWGLIPPWFKQRPSKAIINARSETIAEKPAFRKAYQSRPCLIPASGFFEWSNKDNSKKQACKIESNPQSLLAFAGIWESWQSETGIVYSCAIITCAANRTMATIHPRMPVIIDKNDFQQWLNPELNSSEKQRLLQPKTDNQIRITPISNRINNPRNNDPACLETKN